MNSRYTLQHAKSAIPKHVPKPKTEAKIIHFTQKSRIQ
jgi:hypothetical protein